MQFTHPNKIQDQAHPANNNSHIHQFAIAFFVWLVLMFVSLIPFFFASVSAVGDHEIHGIKVGSGGDVYIHGHNLTCLEASPSRNCSMVIDGKLLEVNAPIINPYTAWERTAGTPPCTATFGGERLGCRLGAITGPTGGPYSIFSGVYLSNSEFEQSVQNDPASWRNWRNLFLGHSPEEELTGYLNYWAVAGFILLYMVIPMFVGYFRTTFFVKPPSARMIGVSLIGLAVGMGIIGFYFGLGFVVTVLLRMLLLGVIVGATALAIFKAKRIEIDVKTFVANFSMRLMHITAMVPFIYAFALIAMIMLGYDD